MGIYSNLLLSASLLVSGNSFTIASAKTDVKPDLSFFAISDIHMEEQGSQSMTYEGFEDALQDMKRLNADYDAVVIPGDLTNNGKEAEYQAFSNLLEANSASNPMLAMGNHDVRWQCSSADRNPASPTVPTCKLGTSTFDTRYLSFNKNYMGDIPEGQLYYDQWINGYHFITLNTEQDLKDMAYLSEQQLAWLDTKLQENADVNKPIFISIHQAFSDATYQPGNGEAHIGEQEEALKKILKKYPQTVVMTGHTHPSIMSADVYNKDYAHVFEVPGLYYNGGFGDTRGRIGYQVNVYGDEIELKLYDFKNDTWLDSYDKSFKLSDIDKDQELDEDDIFDLSLQGMSASAGSQNSTSGTEGPASNVLDENESTKWHTKYGGTPISDNWINLHLDEKQAVNGLRYLPRQDGGTNGTILQYEIYISDDNGKTYIKATNGSWKANSNWKTAQFETKEITDVKLQPVITATTPRIEYSSAAEIRLTYQAEDGFVDKDKLEALLIQCESIHQKDYLNKNWEVYQSALATAKEVFANPDATQIEVSKSTRELSKAIENLELRPTVDNPIIHPVNAIAGSTYGGNQKPINVVNGVGMSGDGSMSDKHDNQSSAKTMWHTAANPGDKAWFEVDLGEVFAIDEMWIWNMNQYNNIDRGFKNVKIEYSLNETDWIELQPENSMEFLEETTAGYPFQFTKSDGSALMGYTNLNDGNKTPVRFDGVNAQYIRITAAPTVGEGSWGNTIFGISELRFTQYFKNIDKAALEKLINDCDRLVKEDYTAASWDAMQTVLGNAKDIIASDVATQDDINAITEQLTKAVAALVKLEDTAFIKQLLAGAMSKAEALIAGDDFAILAPKVKAMINTRFIEAQVAYDNPETTIVECFTAWLNLTEALHYADFKADKALLKTLIEECELINTDDYSEGVEAFETALLKANEVYANDKVLQDTIDAAYDALIIAKANLKEKPVEIINKDSLSYAITIANAALAAKDDYAQNNAWKIFEAALSNAILVLNDENIDQETVNKATSELMNAYENIRLLPSEEMLSKLKDFINNIDRLNRSLFNNDELAMIDEAYAKAIMMLENKDFDKKVFNVFDGTMKKIIKMIDDNDIKVPNSNNKNELTKPDSSNYNKTSATKPVTADTTNVIGFVILIMLSGSGIIFLRKKRETIEK